ncbi:carbohydrate esterase family 8 protein [Dothidotthia symphoricarpi CBS 119687]|uniref:Pectinesterase n=1 Tax=Dothidotthia symphoricarpi CBS 119687 TaxID=1392245 RepID=A0A6A6A9T9_9PLEO|nr:carbohydrate esterase family 8 protein [Dothidotthia symphoricarpi CBS 119687]KAF2127441.1 carbohydrate esterase family 8 protein [Dothidotthia symphoricarpi CBS 119687]
MTGFHRLLALACLFYVAIAGPAVRRDPLAINTSISLARSKKQTSPSKGSLVVDASGQHANSYTTISAAVLALQPNTTTPQSIFIYPGTYNEQVYIGPLTSLLTIQGYTPNTYAYTSNLVSLTYNLSRNTPGLANNDATSTLRLWSPNTKIYNLNITNSFGQAAKNGQALALSAQASNQSFYACAFAGYQDTIYANEGRQLYARSYIAGAVDFIFGLRARAWFHAADISVVGTGFITANGRDAANNTSFYVFNEARVTGATPNSTVLGRPWRTFSRVVFQRSFLGDVVKAVGWERWDDVQSTDDVYYGEYKNYGPGAAGAGVRANFSRQLTQRVSEEEVLGEGFRAEAWVDTAFLT